MAAPALPKTRIGRDLQPTMGSEPAHGTVDGGLGEAALLGDGPQRRVGTVARERLAVLSDDQGGQADGGKRDGSFTPKGMTKRKQSGQILLLQCPLDYRLDHDASTSPVGPTAACPGGCLVYAFLVVPRRISLASIPRQALAQR